MPATTLAFPTARRRRINPALATAARLLCRHNARAYIAAVELTGEILEQALGAPGLEDAADLAERQQARAQAALLDSILLAGEPCDCDGHRFDVRGTEGGWALHVGAN